MSTKILPALFLAAVGLVPAVPVVTAEGVCVHDDPTNPPIICVPPPMEIELIGPIEEVVVPGFGEVIAVVGTVTVCFQPTLCRTVAGAGLSDPCEAWATFTCTPNTVLGIEPVDFEAPALFPIFCLWEAALKIDYDSDGDWDETDPFVSLQPVETCPE